MHRNEEDLAESLAREVAPRQGFYLFCHVADEGQQTEWQLHAHEVWVLASYLQIALRHPGTRDHSSRQIVVDFLRSVRETLITPGSAMEEVWILGEQGAEAADGT